MKFPQRSKKLHFINDKCYTFIIKKIYGWFEGWPFLINVLNTSFGVRVYVRNEIFMTIYTFMQCSEKMIYSCPRENYREQIRAEGCAKIKGARKFSPQILGFFQFLKILNFNWPKKAKKSTFSTFS